MTDWNIIVITGTNPKYLYARACAWSGGFLQCLCGFGHAPGTTELMSVHKRDPSFHNSGMPLDKVLACDDQVDGNLSLAHFNNFSLLLSDGQYTAANKKIKVESTLQSVINISTNTNWNVMAFFPQNIDSQFQPHPCLLIRYLWHECFIRAPISSEIINQAVATPIHFCSNWKVVGKQRALVRSKLY